jgi:protocatechuate 3,4-dioxygenase beta subunit
MLRARSTKLPRVVAALAAMALLAVTTPVFGQASTTATVRGTVEDTSGGVLPGATVTLTNAGTGATQVAVTNERGGYQFTGLFPGTYSLKVELEGFRGYEQQNIAISPNDTRGIDVRLEVGR